MTILYSLLCLLAVFGVSFSIPVDLAGHRIELVRRSHEPDGPTEYGRSMMKYNITPTHPQALPLHERLTRRDLSNDKIPVALVATGTSYKTPLKIGSQQYLLDFDTGSPDLWVYSSFMDTPPPGRHTIYDPSNSTTATATNETWGILYGDGSKASGIVFRDTIEIGGITIKNQAVEAAVVVSGKVLKLESDGLLGLSLGPNTITPGKIPTTLRNLADSPQLGSRLFTCALTRPEEPNGFFTFGFIDSMLLGLKTPEYTPVDPENGYWEFSSDFFVINGKRIPRPSNTAFADTGTTIILVSDDILPTIYEPLGGFFDADLQGWIFPADIEDSKIPAVILPAGNATVTLDKQDLGYASNGSFVFGSIQSRGDRKFDTFGDYWLRNVYAIWDFGTTKEGLRFGVVPRIASS